VLALPYSTAKGGLLFAPFCIAGIALWNSEACRLMMECKDNLDMASLPTDLSSTYSKIAYTGAGRMGVAITDTAIVVTLLGVCIAYQITFSQLLQQIPWTANSTGVLSIISGLIVFPISCVHNVGMLAAFSIFGMVCLIVSVFAILTYGFLYYGDSAVEMGEDGPNNHLLPLWPESISHLTSFVGVSVFCFGLCSLAFPVEESMQRRNEFPTAVLWCLVFVWTLYVLLGDGGAILFAAAPNGIQDNILGNLPVDSKVALVVRLAMAGVSLLTYPLTLVPPAQMIEHYLLSYTQTHMQMQMQMHLQNQVPMYSPTSGAWNIKYGSKSIGSMGSMGSIGREDPGSNSWVL
jgi:amino acid permease